MRRRSASRAASCSWTKLGGFSPAALQSPLVDHPLAGCRTDLARPAERTIVISIAILWFACAGCAHARVRARAARAARAVWPKVVAVCCAISARKWVAVTLHLDHHLQHRVALRSTEANVLFSARLRVVEIVTKHHAVRQPLRAHACVVSCQTLTGLRQHVLGKPPLQLRPRQRRCCCRAQCENPRARLLLAIALVARAAAVEGHCCRWWLAGSAAWLVALEQVVPSLALPSSRVEEPGCASAACVVHARLCRDCDCRQDRAAPARSAPHKALADRRKTSQSRCSSSSALSTPETAAPLPDGLSFEDEAAPPMHVVETDCPAVPVAVTELAIAVQRLAHGGTKRTAPTPQKEDGGPTFQTGDYPGNVSIGLRLSPPAPHFHAAAEAATAARGIKSSRLAQGRSAWPSCASAASCTAVVAVRDAASSRRARGGSSP